MLAMTKVQRGYISITFLQGNFMTSRWTRKIRTLYMEERKMMQRCMVMRTNGIRSSLTNGNICGLIHGVGETDASR